MGNLSHGFSNKNHWDHRIFWAKTAQLQDVGGEDHPTPGRQVLRQVRLRRLRPWPGLAAEPAKSWCHGRGWMGFFGGNIFTRKRWIFYHGFYHDHGAFRGQFSQESQSMNSSSEPRQIFKAGLFMLFFFWRFLLEYLLQDPGRFDLHFLSWIHFGSFFYLIVEVGFLEDFSRRSGVYFTGGKGDFAAGCEILSLFLGGASILAEKKEWFRLWWDFLFRILGPEQPRFWGSKEDLGATEHFHHGSWQRRGHGLVLTQSWTEESGFLATKKSGYGMNTLILANVFCIATKFYTGEWYYQYAMYPIVSQSLLLVTQEIHLKNFTFRDLETRFQCPCLGTEKGMQGESTRNIRLVRKRSKKSYAPIFSFWYSTTLHNDILNLHHLHQI